LSHVRQEKPYPGAVPNQGNLRGMKKSKVTVWKPPNWIHKTCRQSRQPLLRNFLFYSSIFWRFLFQNKKKRFVIEQLVVLNKSLLAIVRLAAHVSNE